MNRKKWIKVWAVIFILFTLIVGIFNYLVDPMWMFQHSFKFNNLQYAFSEKKLKTYYLNNNRNKFDSLLIGSSRTTYYNQNEFKNMKVFNYSISAGKPYEYIDFINYYKKNTEMRYLILGMDFFDSNINKNENKSKKIINNRKLLEGIDSSNLLMSFIKNYLTLDMIKYSMINLVRFTTSKTGHRSYNRNNIVLVDKVNEKEVERIAIKRSKKYYANTLSYDNKISSVFNKIKNNNPNTQIIVYTTPLSKPFLDYIFNDKKLTKYYFMWIRDLVNSFGKIYLTTYYNDLSLNYKLYSKDGDHFYPLIGKEITQFISGSKQATSTIDISNNIMEINSNNIDECLDILKLKIKSSGFVK